MSEVQDSWKEVAGKAEALGLKLKLHLEQEHSDDAERNPGDTKKMVDDLGKKLSEAFDSFGNAAKDPAVHSDVKEIGALFKDALLTTFHKVGAEVSSRGGGEHSGGEHSGGDDSTSDAGTPGPDGGVGDETNGGDA